MQKGLITERHIKWLKDNFNLTFADIEQMTDEQSDTLCNELLGIECDALEKIAMSWGLSTRYKTLSLMRHQNTMMQ